jgi:hypothetical protein
MLLYIPEEDSTESTLSQNAVVVVVVVVACLSVA